MAPLRTPQVHAYLQVFGQPSRLQVKPVFVGSQVPPLHFLVMKLKLHLCSREDVYLGFEVLHVKSPAPKGVSPSVSHHTHNPGQDPESTQRASRLSWASKSAQLFMKTNRRDNRNNNTF